MKITLRTLFSIFPYYFLSLFFFCLQITLAGRTNKQTSKRSSVDVLLLVATASTPSPHPLLKPNLLYDLVY